MLSRVRQEPQLIPEDILAFYRDYNFVCSFTTPAERVRLAACLDDGVLPKELDSQRHHEVFSRMKRLIHQVLILDPDMVIPSGAGKNLQKLVFSQELFEVQDFRRIKKTVLGLMFLPMLLIQKWLCAISQEYEDNQGETDKLPSESQILQESRSRIEQRRKHTPGNV